MDIIEILKYIALGIIQGITEIFPVSSSGHLVIFSHLFFGGNDLTSELKLFLIITNFGSFLALVIYYFKDLKKLILGSLNYLFKSEKQDEDRYEFHYALKIIVCIIPIGVVGLFFNDLIPANLFGVGISLIITSLLLAYLFIIRNHVFNRTLTYLSALGIGLFQVFALVPGISRSGVSITAGVAQKINLKEVLRFSFLSYIFISIPVTALGLYQAIQDPGVINLLGFTLSFIFAFIFSYLTVQVINRFVTLKNLIYFSIYCLLMGSFALIWSFF